MLAHQRHRFPDVLGFCSVACRAGLAACSTGSAISPMSSCIECCAGAARLSATNIANAFPEKSADRARSRSCSNRTATSAASSPSRLWGWNASAEALAARVRIQNPELITRFTAKGQSVVLLAAHFCNWEWLLLTAGVVLKVPIDAVYKPQRDEAASTNS